MILTMVVRHEFNVNARRIARRHAGRGNSPHATIVFFDMPRNAVDVRVAEAKDWMLLKKIRLTALSDTPTAFGVSYETAASYTDEQWQERASARTGAEFWLAFIDGEAVGMIGGGISRSNRYNLIGMWVAPQARGSGIASRLVEAVKIRAIQKGHERIFLDVAPDNVRAANFYLKQGFVFIEEWEALASHPHITVQTMVWTASQTPVTFAPQNTPRS